MTKRNDAFESDENVNDRRTGGHFNALQEEGNFFFFPARVKIVEKFVIYDGETRRVGIHPIISVPTSTHFQFDLSSARRGRDSG